MRHLSTSLLMHLTLTSMLTMVSSGCTTVQVTKVQELKATSWTFWLNPLNIWDELTSSGPAEPDTKAKGVRYFLPKPYLLATPLPEGKIDVSVIYLPDPDQEYAVDTHVYVAAQDVHLEFAGEVDAGKSLLSKVTYEPKDPTVLANIVKGAGTIGKDIIDAKKAKKDAEEQQHKDRQTKLDELKKEERAKKTTLDEKQYLMEIAQTKLDRFTARNPGSEKQSDKESLEDEVRVAKRARDVAEADYKEAQEARKTFENRNPSISVTDVDTSKLSARSKAASLPGPALFEIKENETSVTLEIVKTEGVGSYPNGQMELKTLTSTSGQVQQPANFSSPPPPTSSAVDGIYTISMGFHQEIERLSVFDVKIKMDEGVSENVDKSYQNKAGKRLTLKLPANKFPKGKWTIIVTTQEDIFTGKVEFQ